MIYTMTDITKCKGEDCPLRENCWRYKAPADDLYQSWFVDIPFEDGECEHYWEIMLEYIW